MANCKASTSFQTTLNYELQGKTTAKRLDSKFVKSENSG